MKWQWILGFVFCACAGCHAAPAKHYAIQGEVISANAPRKLLTVKHGEIAGLMPAMTMSYEVADEKQIEGLKEGDRISADLVVSDGRGELEKIVLVGHGSEAPATVERK